MAVDFALKFLLAMKCTTTTTVRQRFFGLFSRITWVSRYQEGKTSVDLNEARDVGVLGWQ